MDGNLFPNFQPQIRRAKMPNGRGLGYVANPRLNGADLYVARFSGIALVDSDGKMSDAVLERTAIRSSQPCYRCVLYMRSVGIRRVFWTTADGEWTAAKIRDLVDMLDGKGTCAAETVFVTRHEKLMLQRLA